MSHRFPDVNRALDPKLLTVMISMHARLGAGSGLTVFDRHLVAMICDVIRRESKASSFFDEGDIEEKKESDSDSESDGEEWDRGSDASGYQCRCLRCKSAHEPAIPTFHLISLGLCYAEHASLATVP